MSNFTQITEKAMNMGNAVMAAAMTMMPNAQTCQNHQQAAQRQQTQRHSQNMRTQIPSFTKAENKSVFCFFYSYPDCSYSQHKSPTQFTKRSEKIVKRPEEILNHARQGGARI